MKPFVLTGLLLASNLAFADGLPVFTAQLTNQIVSPGETATLTVAAIDATSFQWRFNGADMAGETNSTLQIPNAQTNNSGYYMVVAKNSTGWVPSQMAWLAVAPPVIDNPPSPATGGGVVPFSNQPNNYFAGQACDYMGTPLNNCWAQVVAGPALDEMEPVGQSIGVTNGYYGSKFLTRTIPTVAPGQDVYYRVDITPGSLFNAQSTVMKLTAGGSGIPTPSVYGLKFLGWWTIEGLEPALRFTTPTNQVRISGETFSLTNTYFAYADYGWPTAQWRKNGNPIPGATNFSCSWFGTGGDFQAILTITNVQAVDAGIYDLEVFGNDWIVGPKTFVSIQITNGCGVFESPRLRGTNFVCDLLGAAGRNYRVQYSTNLLVWDDIVTLSNATGIVTFSNAPASDAIFYRTVLLP